MTSIYRIEIDQLMDYGKNWKEIRKEIPEYKDDNNQYLSYIYETSFDDCIKAIKDILEKGGVKNPEYTIHKWKTLKNKSQRWTVTINTLLTSDNKIENRIEKAIITEYKTC